MIRQEAERKGCKLSQSNSQTNDDDDDDDDEEEEEKRKKKKPTRKSGAEKPKQRGRPRKSPLKEENAAANGIAAGGAGAADAPVQPENGTPKPKRKYVRKQQRTADPPPDEAAEEPPSEAGEEPEPGGRRRRGAAKAALKYLTLLAKEVLSHPSDDPESKSHPGKEDSKSERQTPKAGKRRGRKKKRADSDSSEDKDFVPDVEEEVDPMEEEEEEEDDEDSETDSDMGVHERSPAVQQRSSTSVSGKQHNGLPFSMIRGIWDSAGAYRKFREENHSSWLFPEWLPSTRDWNAVPHSDSGRYVPQELQSAAFSVSREGLSKQDSPQLRLDRFCSLPAHRECWDMVLFTGGPVWALEWCPTPDGAPCRQYVAVACHAGMDDLHPVTRTSSGPGLVQLWDCGELEYNCRPDSPPALVYGLAQDKGFIWGLKWCPSGAWEPPSSNRKASVLPRLGLLAVASSSGVVSIYSLPHPDALLASNRLTSSENNRPPVFKADAVVTLKLGAIKAPRHESGLVLSLDWLPQKPHDVMAVGFYDGVVGLWDLTTKAALLRVREADRSLSLLPHRCFLAHDHAVRALAFCPASRHLLATAGEDRHLKMWDLRRLCDPLMVQKRFLTNEMCWPLTSPGLLIAQDCAFVAKGNQGLHFLGLSTPSYYAIQRNTTVWSMSYSEWLNCVVSADVVGELILSILPQLDHSGPLVKRNILRRFPICFTSMVPREEKEETAEVEEEGGAGVEQEKEQSRKPDEDEEVQRKKGLHLQLDTYKEGVQRSSLHYADSNVKNLGNLEKRSPWKRMKNTESTAKVNMDESTLAALHKVRFSPNMSSHVWLVSGGQAGLLRLHCLRSLISPNARKMIQESRSHFSALHSTQHHTERPTQEQQQDI
uniref:General transcription factor IIIC, polypeptide 2, beta n=1 Tax=Oryzias latipes TaxID=8090 RepID=A0A3P9I9F1_ORYLA